MHKCQVGETAESFYRGFDNAASCLILQKSFSPASCPALHTLPLSFLLLLDNFTLLLFTMNSAWLIFSLLGFMRLLSVWYQLLTSACLYTRKPCCLFSPRFMLNNRRPPVQYLNQALAFSLVQNMTPCSNAVWRGASELQNARRWKNLHAEHQEKM